MKRVFVKISQNSQEKTCPGVIFTKKETLAQTLSCEFCGILKNIYFYRLPVVAASLKYNFIEFLNQKVNSFSRWAYRKTGTRDPRKTGKPGP